MATIRPPVKSDRAKSYTQVKSKRSNVRNDCDYLYRRRLFTLVVYLSSILQRMYQALIDNDVI